MAFGIGNITRPLADAQATISTGGLDQLGGGGIGGIGNILGSITGQDAADAAKETAEIQAQSFREALDYLKEIDALPQAFREGALTQLGAYHGIGIDPSTGEFTQIEATRPTQEQQIQQAMSSPLYQSILGGREAGEEALARRAAMGSGLRGGATTSSLINYNTNLQNQALMSGFQQQQYEEAQRLAGLGGLAQLPSYAPQIAQTQMGIGQTLAQGQLGAAQAKQQGIGNLLSLGGQLGAAAISDERLKDDIVREGATAHPYIFRYSWKWRPESGKKGVERGFIAQEIENVWPDLVETGSDGYKRIYKDKIEQRLKELN